MSTAVAVSISVALIVLSAFFVAVEFALVAARRHRLEEAADTSIAARMALRSARELSLLLAGSQLGITLCTLALGAVTKPLVHDLLTPLLHGTGLPATTADVLAFLLALFVVTFVHLVIGEMAPKSWAIAHPERSATLLAIPMRGFMWLTRPLLLGLNDIANRFLRRAGIQPVDEMTAGQRPEELRQLLDHSAQAGTLDPRRHEQLTTVLDLHTQPIESIAGAEPVSIPPAATREQILRAARESGHLRLIVRDAHRIHGIVHVRDVLTRPATTTAAEHLRPHLTLAPETPIATALTAMRRTHQHLALIRTGEHTHGLVTLHDLLERLLPQTLSPEETA
ncbi:hemolysin family protein [Sciscionella sediminilitoris]|uniref:hemolysin family protein n=1 Tax=Sciscionella sediminilitoris TaxID=1445613 RepID=UPI0004DF8078|nr:hemolysin family protein [Sciscionella sp. SE31]